MVKAKFAQLPKSLKILRARLFVFWKLPVVWTTLSRLGVKWANNIQEWAFLKFTSKMFFATVSPVQILLNDYACYTPYVDTWKRVLWRFQVFWTVFAEVKRWAKINKTSLKIHSFTSDFWNIIYFGFLSNKTFDKFEFKRRN